MITSRRLHHWQTALEALVRQRRRMPFAWGVQDCGLWAADCVQAVTGEDIAADLRGTYKDEQGAARVLKRLGGVAGIAAARLGPAVGPSSAQIGDVVLVQFVGRDTLAVCMGNGTAMAPGVAGLVAVPTAQALRAWRCTREGG